jgi:hypothetical protein
MRCYAIPRYEWADRYAHTTIATKPAAGVARRRSSICLAHGDRGALLAPRHQAKDHP